jgi:hypothetical protein
MLIDSGEVLYIVPNTGAAVKFGVCDGSVGQVGLRGHGVVEVVSVLERRVQVRKSSTDVDFIASSVFGGARSIQRITVGWALSHTAVCTIVTAVTKAPGLKGAVPSIVVGGHECCVIVVKVLNLARAVAFVDGRTDGTSRSVSFGVDLHGHGTSVVFSKVSVILADSVAAAIVGAGSTLACRTFVAFVAVAHTSGTVANTGVRALHRSFMESGTCNSRKRDTTWASHKGAISTSELSLEGVFSPDVTGSIKHFSLKVATTLIVGVALTASRTRVGA